MDTKGEWERWQKEYDIRGEKVEKKDWVRSMDYRLSKEEKIKYYWSLKLQLAELTHRESKIYLASSSN